MYRQPRSAEYAPLHRRSRPCGWSGVPGPTGKVCAIAKSPSSHYLEVVPREGWFDRTTCSITPGVYRTRLPFEKSGAPRVTAATSRICILHAYIGPLPIARAAAENLRSVSLSRDGSAFDPGVVPRARARAVVT